MHCVPAQAPFTRQGDALEPSASCTIAGSPEAFIRRRTRTYGSVKTWLLRTLICMSMSQGKARTEWCTCAVDSAEGGVWHKPTQSQPMLDFVLSPHDPELCAVKNTRTLLLQSHTNLHLNSGKVPWTSAKRWTSSITPARNPTKFRTILS